jgi:hypothetical protein
LLKRVVIVFSCILSLYLIAITQKRTAVKKIHDSLFKDALSYPGEAEKLIKDYTKPAILEHIDWSTLEASKTNFVNEKLSQTYLDVVYVCRLLDQKTYLYFLLESQTEPDFYFPHRLEKYRLAITEDHLKKEVFYHTYLPYAYIVAQVPLTY